MVSLSPGKSGRGPCTYTPLHPISIRAAPTHSGVDRYCVGMICQLLMPLAALDQYRRTSPAPPPWKKSTLQRDTWLYDGH